MSIAELRSDTLATWKVFIRELRYADSGPFIGRTTAALTANWSDFGEDDRRQAVEMVSEITENAQQLLPFLDDVVDMSHIPELAFASKLWQRRDWPLVKQIDRMLERPNATMTRVGGNVLWNMATLELWLQRHVDRV